MIQIIPSVFRLITNREVKLPPFSVTSTLPSIMNGGKDFSPWSKNDDLLYKTMRIPVEAVLGKDGVGLADCAIAESKFEKGEDISGRILLLVSQLGEVQKETRILSLQSVGLLARSQIALGRAEDALRTVQMARERFEENGHTRFFHNMDAVICRIWLHMDDFERVQVWYRAGTEGSASFKCFKALSISYRRWQSLHSECQMQHLTLQPLSYIARIVQGI